MEYGAPIEGLEINRCHHGESNCEMCHAEGLDARIAAGEALRQDRISRGIRLRDEAARLGITPRELSDLENGRWRS